MFKSVIQLHYLPLQGSPLPSGKVECERLLTESQKEVLRLQRQLSVTSCRQQDSHTPNPVGPEEGAVVEEVDKREKKVNSPHLPVLKTMRPV